jgi:hypothetical protein
MTRFWTWIGIGFLLLLIAGMCYLVNLAGCIDGCGPYHNTSSVADLDGDGDLDIVVSNLRHESETLIWAGPTLWINQGRGKFTSHGVTIGGPSTAVGDVDGDGDADLVQVTYGANIVFNQGGEQGGEPGDFSMGLGRPIEPQEDPHDWAGIGFVVLGDLNGDGLLDAFGSYCCAMLMDELSLEEGYLQFLPWVWVNTIGSHNLYPVGDLPMRPALGDLDGDGDLDVYAAALPPNGSDYDSADRVLLNDGSGNFVDSGQLLENHRLAGAAGSGSVALGDLDGDGDLDALVATASGAAIWTNQGGAHGGQAGVFASSGLRLGRGHVEDVFLADLDADGDLDALVGEKSKVSVWLDATIAYGKSQTSIWWNDGQGDFLDSGQRLHYSERHGLAVGDFDGDGHSDFLAAAYDSDVRLWLNQGDGRLE